MAEHSYCKVRLQNHSPYVQIVFQKGFNQGSQIFQLIFEGNKPIGDVEGGSKGRSITIRDIFVASVKGVGGGGFGNVIRCKGSREVGIGIKDSSWVIQVMELVDGRGRWEE